MAAASFARRDLFGVAAAAVALSVPVAAPAAVLSGDWMVTEAGALIDLESRLNASDAPEEEWLAWDKRRDAFLDMAEALPCRAEFMKAKALAFFLIHRGDLGNFVDDNPATDQRLAAQIVQTAMGLS